MGLKKSWLSALVFFGGSHGLRHRDRVDILSLVVRVSADRRGQAGEFLHGAGVFPIMFELTVLLSAFTATFGMLALNGLPRWNHPMFNWDRFKKVSNDGGFFLATRRPTRSSTREATRAMLEGLGAHHITLVHGA